MKQLPFWQRPYFARRVLDIGSGHNPFKGATLVVDFDLKEGRDRHGNPLVVPEPARLFAADVQALPFQARSFDYVYASHVLEHVYWPGDACREIMRVGSAGYVETPSPLLEQGLAYKDKDLPSIGCTNGSCVPPLRLSWSSSQRLGPPSRSFAPVRMASS